MSFLDKIAAKIMPPESESDRREARTKAEQLGRSHPWLAMAIDHHRQIESAFSRALDPAADAPARKNALKGLATVLNGHSLAEEVVLYPALVEAGGKAGATMAYEEQSMTKVEMHMLESLDPMGQEWRDKLEHIQGAVLHHIYEEESAHFPKIAENCHGSEAAMLNQRFAQEYERYAGSSKISEPLSEPA